MKMIDYTLPEFVFLDGSNHEGDTLADRTVLLHTRTCSIIEVIALDEVQTSSFKTPTYHFEFRHSAGVIERFMFALHFSNIHENDVPASQALNKVFHLCAEWYCDYLAWEDRNIQQDSKAGGN